MTGDDLCERGVLVIFVGRDFELLSPFSFDSFLWTSWGL
jgi:hypothetical protein